MLQLSRSGRHNAASDKSRLAQGVGIQDLGAVEACFGLGVWGSVHGCQLRRAFTVTCAQEPDLFWSSVALSTVDGLKVQGPLFGFGGWSLGFCAWVPAAPSVYCTQEPDLFWSAVALYG